MEKNKKTTLAVGIIYSDRFCNISLLNIQFTIMVFITYQAAHDRTWQARISMNDLEIINHLRQLSFIIAMPASSLNLETGEFCYDKPSKSIVIPLHSIFTIEENDRG